jgi:DNA-binding beta-propeller fold protein YncE
MMTAVSPARRAIGLVVIAGVVALPAAAERAPAAPHGRLEQLAGERGCVHPTGINRCAAGRGLVSPQDVVVSPDGRHVYVAGGESHSVAVFRRVLPTGRLEQLPGRRGCVAHRGIGPCAQARALARPSALAISPDGRHVYVSAAGSNALAVFARNRRTGALSQLPGSAGCLSQLPGGGCQDGRALNEPLGVAVSPDGRRVYVAANRAPAAVAVLTRARGTGALTQPDGAAGCVAVGGRDGCAPVRALRAPEDIVVGTDSRTVYIADLRGDAVVILRRWPGGLRQPEGADGCIAMSVAGGCAAGHALRGPADLAVAHRGRSLYVAASEADTVANLRIDPRTGALEQARGKAGCIRQEGSRRCAAGRTLDEVWGVATSPDGLNLYSVSAKVNALGATARRPSTGALTPLPGRYACFIRGGGFGCPEGRGLTVAVAVTVSPDGRNVYAASEDIYLGSVAVFRRFVR